MKAGYSIADFSDVPVTLSTATGNVSVENIDPVLVDKLKDMEKPVMIKNLTIDAAGSVIRAAGFTAHLLSAGVHTHTIQGVAISTMGDTALQFTVTA